MSYLSEPGFDIWDTIHCAKCYLPFISNSRSSQSVPFWMTECGHVICNSHLNANQSCARCGAQPIEMIPLQREMEPPLSSWFRSLPHAIDEVAQTAKFQLDSITSLLAFYKEKCFKQRALIERTKADALEAKNLRLRVEELQTENNQLRQYMEYGGPGQSSNTLNNNGKRRMVDTYRTNSSPRTVNTPLAPDRILLPTDHQEPNLVRSDDGPLQPQRSNRPGSSRFSDEYAYTAPRNSQFQQQTVLSHEQIPSTRRLGRTNANNESHSHRKDQASKYPAQLSSSTSVNRQVLNRRPMLPPPTPQAATPLISSTNRFNKNVPASGRVSTLPASNFNQSSVPSTPSNAPQRFFVPASANARQNLRSNNISNGHNGGGGQRVPFVVSSSQNSFQ